MPQVTLESKPKGLPIAIANSPTFTLLESPSSAAVRPVASIFIIFAIPISSTIDITQQLIQYNKVIRPYIGISGRDVTEAAVRPVASIFIIAKSVCESEPTILAS